MLVPLKITLMAAFLVVLPYVLYQVWAFVAPGLYSHEKKFVLPLVISSTVLFFIGVAFCYFIVIPAMSRFIQSFAPTAITAAPDIEQYFGFVLTLFLVFGIAFEVPVAVVVTLFRERGSEIFSARSLPTSRVGRLIDLTRAVLGPKYSGDALRKVLKKGKRPPPVKRVGLSQVLRLLAPFKGVLLNEIESATAQKSDERHLLQIEAELKFAVELLDHIRQRRGLLRATRADD